MATGEPTACRVCDGTPLVGYAGFCEPCAQALARWVAFRRAGVLRRRAAFMALRRSQGG